LLESPINCVAAGAFGFLIFSHAFDGPDLYGALSFFEQSNVFRREAAFLTWGWTTFFELRRSLEFDLSLFLLFAF